MSTSRKIIPSWEDNSSSFSTEIPRILPNPKSHYTAHSSLPLFPLLIQINSFHNLHPISLRYKLILSSKLGICLQILQTFQPENRKQILFYHIHAIIIIIWERQNKHFFVQAMKACRERRGIYPPILNLGDGNDWLILTTVALLPVRESRSYLTGGWFHHKATLDILKKKNISSP